MALDKAVLKSALQTTFEDLSEGKTAAQAAEEMADAIDAYVKTALATVQVPAGTFIVNVTGQAVGVPNPSPVALTGSPSGTPPGGLS